MMRKSTEIAKVKTAHDLIVIAILISIIIGSWGWALGGPAHFELQDESGQPFPFQTQEAVEEFLGTAEIVKIEGIKEGTTHPRRVLLEQDERGEKKVLSSYPVAVEKSPENVQPSLSISLQAKPSRDCIPASSLQLPELREDFSKVCRNCRLVGSDDSSADFTVIVGDPGFSWKVVILGRDGALLKEFEWTGSLTTGLKKAVRVLRQQQQEGFGSEGVKLASTF